MPAREADAGDQVDRASSPRWTCSAGATQAARIPLNLERHHVEPFVLIADMIDLQLRRQLDRRAEERPGGVADGIVGVPEQIVGTVTCISAKLPSGPTKAIAPWFITNTNRPSAPPSTNVGSRWK